MDWALTEPQTRAAARANASSWQPAQQGVHGQRRNILGQQPACIWSLNGWFAMVIPPAARVGATLEPSMQLSSEQHLPLVLACVVAAHAAAAQDQPRCTTPAALLTTVPGISQPHVQPQRSRAHFRGACGSLHRSVLQAACTLEKGVRDLPEEPLRQDIS